MLLTDIQKKQFSDKTGAERDLLQFLKEHEDRSIRKVELQPKPESLNSLNGFVTYESGERYFFKTHTEENEKVSEYYNAEELAKSGYPVITSKQITQKVGSQIVLYQIISYPTLFDLIKIEEDKANTATDTTKEILLNGQIALDKLVFEIYSRNLSTATVEEHAKAPIHQLFSHRLAEDGRVGLFYKNKYLNLETASIPFESLSTMQWTVNDVEYSQSLSEIIERSRDLLQPKQAPVVPGHGDAHNGNIFVDLEHEQFYMFDPAFAGKHHPLLDLTKPLFHNIFARWMYYPDQVLQEFNLNFEIRDNRVHIEHNFKPSALRLAHLKTRVENVLRPTLSLLKEHGALDDSWRSFVRSALFCCPFLTVNLFSDYVANGTLSERYKPPVKLLGLAMAIELGATEHKGSNALTDIIDEVFA
ncbi:MAG: phosphotransferase [Candidatus Melainabacteria bacterium]|nr:phosphotransferase [Candidatus Melainabacteria bacterium]